MTLSEYLDGMRSATTAAELETAIQASYKHRCIGRTWTQISRVRIEAGNRICAAHPNGQFVPHYNSRRELTLCGQTYRVGRGQNSTGIRYSWHAAETWAKNILHTHGFSKRAAYRIWDRWTDYPHRCLAIVDAALAGEIPDPVMNALIPDQNPSGNPLRYSIEQNDADIHDRRATRPCGCGGTLFDWGAGTGEGFDCISWRCNACSNAFTEYMTREQLYALREAARHPLAEQPA